MTNRSANSLAGFLRALAFLTRIPVPARFFTQANADLGTDAASFPLVGLVVAVPAAACLALATGFGLSPFVAATLAIATAVWITGALHEDGLADVADGLGAVRPAERAIEIMRDSRIGVYGTVTLALALLLKVFLLAELLSQSGWVAAACAIAAAAAFSRGAMAWFWSSLPPAGPGGLADRAGRPSPGTGRMALALGTVLLAAFSLPAFGELSSAAILMGFLTLFWFRRFVKKRLGGQTGDTLGACQQLTELAALLGLATFA